MDPTKQLPPSLGGTYAGGTIAIHPDLFASPEFVSKHDKSHTYFCFGLLVALLILALLFPRTIGATGLTYKLREIFLILAGVSFEWTTLKQLKVWQYGALTKSFIFLSFGAILFGMAGGMLVYHGIEERTDQQLQARPYNQTQNLMKK